MGTNATIFTSLDGQIWSKIDLAADVTFNDLNALDCIVFTGTTWIGFAHAFGGVVTTIRSPDMVTLTRIAYPDDAGEIGYAAVGNNTVIATGFFKPIISTNDGLSWTSGSYTDPSYVLAPIAFGNGIFVAAQTISHTAGPVFIQSTTDAVAWTDLATLSDIGHIQSLRFLNNKFWIVATDTGDINNIVYSSPDAITWTPTVLGASSGIRNADIAFGNSTYLIVPQADGFPCFISADGSSWDTGGIMPSASASYIRLAYSHGKFVAITNDNNGFIATTANGLSWNSINPPDGATVDFTDVAASP